MKLAGTIKKILPLETGSSKNGSEWKNQTFIIQYEDGKFTKDAAFSARSDKAIEQLDKQSEGSIVEVSFNIESKENNGRWFTSLNAWKISHV